MEKISVNIKEKVRKLLFFTDKILWLTSYFLSYNLLINSQFGLSLSLKIIGALLL